MFPLLDGAARSEGRYQIAGRAYTFDVPKEPSSEKRPRKLIKHQPPAVTSSLPRKRKLGNESQVLISHPNRETTSLHSDDSQRQRARTLPGSSRSRRVSVELLISLFESLDRDEEDIRPNSRQRAVTAPAPNLRGRYHSALCQGRSPGERQSSAATIVEDKVAEESLSCTKQDTKICKPPETAPSTKMWPFADRDGNPQIESLVPTEDLPREHQEVRRNSMPKGEQQEESANTLRPSKSLSSMKLAPQRRGLCIPPGAAVSEGSEICAKGEVSSPPRKTEKSEQPQSVQTPQAQEEDFEPDHRPGSTEDTVGHPVSQGDTKINASASELKPKSMDNDQELKPVVSPTESEVKQRSFPVLEGKQSAESSPVLTFKEPREPEPVLAANTVQSIVPETLPDGDRIAPAEDVPSPKVVQPEWLHPWPASSPEAGEEAMQRSVVHLPRRSSIASPIPTIRVQQTTESEETVPPAGAASAKKSEARLKEVQEPISEAPARQPHTAAPAWPGCSEQLDAVVPTSAKAAVSLSVPVSESSGVETPSAITPSADKAPGQVDVDRPGFTKLALRKARNMAGNKFVLSILLGRKLAERTKPQLEELARPPIWRPAKMAPALGESQVDGVAELEGEMAIS